MQGLVTIARLLTQLDVADDLTRPKAQRSQQRMRDAYGYSETRCAFVLPLHAASIKPEGLVYGRAGM